MSKIMKSMRCSYVVNSIINIRTMSGFLSHIDESKNLPQMVDISSKTETNRTAHAQAIVSLPRKCFSLLSKSDSGSFEFHSKKGPVFATAIVAGVMAAKNTFSIIPFCHQVLLDKCDIKIVVDDLFTSKLHSIFLKIDCIVSTNHKTGVEMEALVGASTAALCVYDMLKAVSHDIIIMETRLISKTGGKSDYTTVA